MVLAVYGIRPWAGGLQSSVCRGEAWQSRAGVAEWRSAGTAVTLARRRAKGHALGSFSGFPQCLSPATFGFRYAVTGVAVHGIGERWSEKICRHRAVGIDRSHAR